jgi:hypothetical protein
MEQDQARIARAFKAFQDAARNRDTDPETFEAARTRYYYLTKGDAWLDQEKKRISAEKIEPIIAEYRDMYISLNTEENVQKAYTDSIAVIRDKQDELMGGANRQKSFLEKLISEESQKKSAYDRYIELTNPTPVPSAEAPSQDVPVLVRYFSSFPSSFSIIMDVVLAILVLFILILVVTKGKISFDNILITASQFRRQGTGNIIIQTPAFGPSKTATINQR